MFENMKKQFKAEELTLVCQKGVYPYEFIDGIDTLEYPKLPPTTTFYSSLRLSGISVENYEHALNVYENVASF